MKANFLAFAVVVHCSSWGSRSLAESWCSHNAEFQARYRQYFEEDLAAANDPNNDAEVMIPMETQVLMQEVLTDGMAFCSLM